MTLNTKFGYYSIIDYAKFNYEVYKRNIIDYTKDILDSLEQEKIIEPTGYYS